MIVAGTSATVYPAAGFALEVQQRGGILIEVNLYECEMTQYARELARRIGGGAAAAGEGGADIRREALW